MGRESVNWCEQLFHGVEDAKSDYQLSTMAELCCFRPPDNDVLSVLTLTRGILLKLRSKTSSQKILLYML